VTLQGTREAKQNLELRAMARIVGVAKRTSAANPGNTLFIEQYYQRQFLIEQVTYRHSEISGSRRICYQSGHVESVKAVIMCFSTFKYSSPDTVKNRFCENEVVW
jgi:hypothetical protein